MGENVPAANDSEIREVVSHYLSAQTVEVSSADQVDPDATIFSLLIDDETYYLLEEDYISGLEGALFRFQEFGIQDTRLQRVAADDDANQHPLDAYQIFYRPRKLKYEVRYVLAKGKKT
ncbi:MAG: hypothetical protein WDN27_00380 [Candidatus Saccharibacteria bacterium]